MARRNRNRPLVPGARDGLNQFKGEVMRRQGYAVNPAKPDQVKYEVAQTIGVPLRRPGSNGKLTTEQAGKVGGRIGGSMVREMIRMAEQHLARRR